MVLVVCEFVCRRHSCSNIRSLLHRIRGQLVCFLHFFRHFLFLLRRDKHFQQLMLPLTDVAVRQVQTRFLPLVVPQHRQLLTVGGVHLAPLDAMDSLRLALMKASRSLSSAGGLTNHHDFLKASPPLVAAACTGELGPPSTA